MAVRAANVLFMDPPLPRLFEAARSRMSDLDIQELGWRLMDCPRFEVDSVMRAELMRRVLDVAIEEAIASKSTLRYLGDVGPWRLRDA